MRMSTQVNLINMVYYYLKMNKYNIIRKKTKVKGFVLVCNRKNPFYFIYKYTFIEVRESLKLT